jgi:hypothetical protein
LNAAALGREPEALKSRTESFLPKTTFKRFHEVNTPMGKLKSQHMNRAVNGILFVDGAFLDMKFNPFCELDRVVVNGMNRRIPGQRTPPAAAECFVRDIAC